MGSARRTRANGGVRNRERARPTRRGGPLRRVRRGLGARGGAVRSCANVPVHPALATAMTPSPRVNLLDLEPDEAIAVLRAFAVESGEAAYRGTQAARHLWTSPTADFSAMSD